MNSQSSAYFKGRQGFHQVQQSNFNQKDDSELNSRLNLSNINQNDDINKSLLNVERSKAQQFVGDRSREKIISGQNNFQQSTSLSFGLGAISLLPHAEKYDQYYSQNYFRNENFFDTKYQLTSQKNFLSPNVRLQNISSRDSQPGTSNCSPLSSNIRVISSNFDCQNVSLNSNVSLPSTSSKNKNFSNPEVILKPTTFVDSSGNLSGLDFLIKELGPKEVSGQFTVNAIVGTSGSGKSSTWNEILKKSVFKVRKNNFLEAIHKTDNRVKNSKASKDKLFVLEKSKERREIKNDEYDHKQDSCFFQKFTENIEVALCQRTVGRWFVFDTPPLLFSSNSSFSSNYLTKKLFDENFLSKSSCYLQMNTSQSLLFSPQASSSISIKSSLSKQNSRVYSTRSPIKTNKKSNNFVTSSNVSNQSLSKNATLLSLQTLIFLFVCSDNVIIILDPFTSLDDLFCILRTAIMIVGCPTSTLYFYLPEEKLVNFLNPSEVLNSIQNRLIKHFWSKADYSLVTSEEELAIFLNQPNIRRFSALIDYSSEHSWIISAHRYWKDIDIPGNLLYEYSSEHDRINLIEDEEDTDEKLFSLADVLGTKQKQNIRSNKSQAITKTEMKSSKSEFIKGERKPKTDEYKKTEGNVLEKETSFMKEKKRRGGFEKRGKAGFWRGSSRGAASCSK